MANTVSQNHSRTFRPWPENQAHFKFAEDVKLNVSELINEILAKHFKRHVQHKIKMTQRKLELSLVNGTHTKGRR